MGKKILFVDDSASMRQIVGMAISGAGYEVTTAEDGADGVSKMDQDKFDLIISDVNMPNMNGIEMLKAAKLNPKNKFAPVIMLTTEAGDDMKQQGKAAGAKVWVVKPFKPDQLLGVIKKLIG
ncbi:MAG: two-component system response regulator [endosymbiont of Galathealinum brachiosum]|uniref:Two-component system response regulator n=1 Tax=endosymbiont of Galathealinum brachiosum TaxID=2200906 RepID=A0A370DNH5_9GAMM|nr:MAG: two-component system response regulator [endosymbiont of Galathealinum brachiosum]